MSGLTNKGNIIPTPEEILLIQLLREKPFQEIVIKVQGGLILSVERKEKFIRKKNGSIFG